MLRNIFKALAFKRLLGFGSRHKALSIGSLLAMLGLRNRHRARGLLGRRRLA